MEDKREHKEQKEHSEARGKSWVLLGKVGNSGRWKVRVLGKIRRFWGNSRHVDMRIAVIHEIMGGHINLVRFLMGILRGSIL